MNRTKIGSNMYQGVTRSGVTVLFSYDTPVACYHVTHGYLVTNKKWSVTTSKHSNNWLANDALKTHRTCGLGNDSFVLWDYMPQEYFDALIES